MLFSILVLFVASISAAAIEQGHDLSQRDGLAQYVSNFKAECVQHSALCNYTFGVTSEPGTLPPTQCFASVNGFETLPEVVDQNDCKSGKILNTAIHWSMTKTSAGGLTFDLWYPLNSRSNLTFCYDICPEHLKLETHYTVRTQRYIGPEYFKMDVCADQRHKTI